MSGLLSQADVNANGQLSMKDNPVSTEPSLTGRLSVDLQALVKNWRALDAMTGPDCRTAAVVKADGYGCGAGHVGAALAKAGARTFFVAVPSEGATLRKALGPDPEILILGGYAPAERALFLAHDLRPVLNSSWQFSRWFEGPAGPCAVQIDTGMNRLGMEADELATLGPLPRNVDLVISHMGCADMSGHPLNERQLEAFRAMTTGLDCRLSLSATAGLLLGPDYHFDLTRVGIGLYGGAPYDDGQPVVGVEIPIIQIRDVSAGESVGYGAAYVADRPRRIATISAGYADGLIRALSNGASAFIDGHPVALAGRVSMDLITLDVTDCPCEPGDMVEVLGPNQSIDALAKAAGTIGHEVLTSLGSRYLRDYV